MANVDDVIRRCVDDIWDEYDADKSNALDMAETKAFVKQTLREFAGEAAIENFSDEEFEFTFKLFDRDDNGTIDKSEMVVFIRKVAGLSVGRLDESQPASLH